LIKNRKEPEANIISAHKIMTHANYIDPALREQFLSRLQESTPGKRLATIYGTGRSYRPTSNEPIGKEIALARHDWELLCQFLRGQIIGVGADDIPKTAGISFDSHVSQSASSQRRWRVGSAVVLV